MDYPKSKAVELALVGDKFADYNPVGDVAGSIVPAGDWANAITDEIIAAQAAAGLTAAEGQNDQLAAAIRILARGGALGFRVKPQAPASLSVDIEAGAFFSRSTGLLVSVAATNAGPISAPAGNPRHDIVYIDALTGAPGIQTGAEAAGPVDPAIPAGKLPLARIIAYVGMTEIVAGDLEELRYLQTIGFLQQSAFDTGLLHVRDVKPSGTIGGGSSAGTNIRVLNTELTGEIAGGGLVFTIPYDAQTGNFTVGQIVTETTNGGTALIVGDSDAGATGTLKVIKISGTFADNQPLTDPLGGAATSNIPAGTPEANQLYLPAGNYHCSGSAPAFDSGGQQAWLYDVTGAAVLVLGTTASIAVNADLRCFVDGRFSLAAPSLVEFQHHISVGRANGLGVPGGSANSEVYADLMVWKVV